MVSGGYPPFGQELRISADGEATVALTSLGGRRRILHLTVAPDELARIRRELTAAQLGELADPELTCSDCVLYEIRYEGERFAADMLTIPDGLEPAFHRLDRVIRRAE